jgi:hypothetical protein
MCSGKLLEVGLELANGGRRTRDMGSNSSDVSSGVTVWLVLQTAGFEAIKDFFGRHWRVRGLHGTRKWI